MQDSPLTQKRQNYLSNGERSQLVVGGRILGWVKDAIYMEQLISFEGRASKEGNRITIAFKKYWPLSFIFKPDLDIGIKRSF